MPKSPAPVAMEPLKLIALDEEDLAVVSSLLQDAVLRVADMTYRAGAEALRRRAQPLRLGEGGEAGATARISGGGARRSDSTACSAPSSRT